jgi:hypothetical protein
MPSCRICGAEIKADDAYRLIDDGPQCYEVEHFDCVNTSAGFEKTPKGLPEFRWEGQSK